MLTAFSLSVMNAVLLGSAVVPPLIVGVVCWIFFRAARRNDERERQTGTEPPG